MDDYEYSDYAKVPVATNPEELLLLIDIFEGYHETRRQVSEEHQNFMLRVVRAYKNRCHKQINELESQLDVCHA